MDNKSNRRLKGYYGFSKKYPSKRGTLYAIGESRKTKKKERYIKILRVALILLFSAIALIVFFFCRNLSKRPIPEAPSEEVEAVVSADNIGQIKAIFIENSVLSDEIEFQKRLDFAKSNGFNSIMLDFKDADGSVLFSDRYADSVGEKNQITKAVLNEIKSKGFTVVARVYCFCDSYAPQRTGAYVFENSERTKPWFSAAASTGGVVWLNPADGRAETYLLQVISDASDYGADCIYLQSVEFPVSEENPPVFTEDDASLSRNFLLMGFVEKAVARCGRCPVILGFSFDGIDGSDEKWGGTLFDSAAHGCSPEIPVSDNYAEYVGDMWTILNERAKNNYSTLKCIPTVKNIPDNENFYDELAKNGAQSYIIIP